MDPPSEKWQRVLRTVEAIRASDARCKRMQDQIDHMQQMQLDELSPLVLRTPRAAPRKAQMTHG